MVNPEEERGAESNDRRSALDYTVSRLAMGVSLDAADERTAHERLNTLLFLVDWKAAIEADYVLTGFEWTMTGGGPVAVERGDSPSFEHARTAIAESGSDMQIDDIIDHIVDLGQELPWDKVTELAYHTYPSYDAFHSFPRFPSGRVVDLVEVADRYRETDTYNQGEAA